MKLDQLYKKFDNISIRLFNLNLLVDDYITLFRDKVVISEQNSFLKRVKHAISNDMILELYKLLNENEKGSLYKFFNISINNFKSINWKTDIKVDYFKNLAKIFNEPRYVVIYSKIKKVRDEISAHNDKDIINDGPSYHDLEYLIKYLNKIIDDIDLKVFCSQNISEIEDYQRSIMLIDQLEKYNRIRDFILTSEFNMMKSIDIKELNKLI